MPTSSPSGEIKRVTVWPQGSFLFLTRIRYPRDSRSAVAFSTLSTSNSNHACGRECLQATTRYQHRNTPHGKEATRRKFLRLEELPYVASLLFLRFERYAEGFAVQFATFGGLADNRTKTSNEQNLETSSTLNGISSSPNNSGNCHLDPSGQFGGYWPRDEAEG